MRRMNEKYPFSSSRVIGKCTHIEHEDDPTIDVGTFEWKGCWKCYRFERDGKFPYYSVKEVAEMLEVSKSTIRRWVKEGNLEGKLFEQGRWRYRDSFPLKKYYITKKSVKEAMKEGKR